MSFDQSYKYSISIDLGTSSCKVCAVDVYGRIAGSASEGYPTYSPHSGWAEQDPETWMKSVSAAVAKLRTSVHIEATSSITLTSARISRSSWTAPVIRSAELCSGAISAHGWRPIA